MKKKSVKISVVVLVVLLLFGVCMIGLPFLQGMRMKKGKFPTPDRVIISIVENGEVIERELSRAERREMLKLFDDSYSIREQNIGLGVGATHFFKHYEQYGVIKFYYNSNHGYIYSYNPYVGSNEVKWNHRTYNAIYLVVTDGLVYAYEVYNGTLTYCIDALLYESVDRGDLFAKYAPNKEVSQ